MRRWDRAPWWQLLEPDADQDGVADALRRVLDLADGRSTDRPIDLSRPLIRHLLERHRVLTVIPLELVDTATRPLVRSLQIEIAAAQMRLRHAATRALEVLAADDIDVRVLKGLATADLDHHDRSMRHTGDVDLAVAPERLDDAVRLLVADGCRLQPTPFDPVLWYGLTLETPDGVEIDLHTRLFRRSPLGNTLVGEPGVALTSMPGLALPAEQRLVHAAGHFMISPPGTRRMNGFLDIGRLVERSDLELEGARRAACELGVESLVGAGIRVEAELNGREDVVSGLASWAQPDWLERQTRLVAHRRLILDHLGRYREVPRGRRLEYLPAWLLPTARQRRLLRDSAMAAGSRTIRAVRSPRRATP